MHPTPGPVTGVVNLDLSPFVQLARNIVSGCRDRDLLMGRVRAASRDDKINELSLETGIDEEYPFWMQQCVLRIFHMSSGCGLSGDGESEAYTREIFPLKYDLALA